MEFFFLHIFPFAFIAMGAGAVWSGLRQIRLARASRCWPSVTGVVQQSEVLSTSDGEGGIEFHPVIAYEFEVSGQRIRGTQVAFGDLTTPRRNRAEQRVSRYPTGVSVQVYYDPSEPETSVLEHAPEAGTWFFIGAGLLFIAAGVALAIFMPVFLHEFHKR